MTTTYTQALPTTSRWPLAAALGAGAALVLTAVGTFKDGAGKHGWAEYAVTSAVILVLTALIFWFVVRTATAANAGTRCLVLGIAALVGVVLFWLGLPAVLAAASFSCALVRREHGDRLGAGTVVGVMAGAAAVVIAVVAAFLG